MTVYVDNSKGQTIYGVNPGPFKVNHCLLIERKRKRGNVLHLGLVKPTMVTVYALFTAVNSGVMLASGGDFYYQSDDNLLTITNVSGVVGMIGFDNDYAIPLTGAVDWGVALTDFHLIPEPLASGV